MKLKIPLMLLPLVFMPCSKEMPFDNKNGFAEIRIYAERFIWRNIRMARNISIIILLLCLVGCKNASNEKIPSRAEYEAYMQELGSLKDSVSLVMVQNFKVKDNKVVFALNRKDIIKMGLPSIVYDVAIYNESEINALLQGLDPDVLEQVIPQLEEQLDQFIIK